MTNTEALTYNINDSVDLAAFLLKEGDVDEREVDPSLVDAFVTSGWVEVLDVGCYRQVLPLPAGVAVFQAAELAARRVLVWYSKRA